MLGHVLRCINWLSFGNSVCLCVCAASLLKRLKHANIVVLHDIIHTRESLTLVFEYVVRNTFFGNREDLQQRADDIIGQSWLSLILTLFLLLVLLQQTDLAQYMTQHPGGLHSQNVRVCSHHQDVKYIYVCRSDPSHPEFQG